MVVITVRGRRWRMIMVMKMTAVVVTSSGGGGEMGDAAIFW